MGACGYGHASNTNNIGVYGVSENDGLFNVGIYGSSLTHGTGKDWAGYFAGDVSIVNALTVGGNTSINGSVYIPNGNVGIGTNNPGYPLDVETSVNTTVSYEYLNSSGVNHTTSDNQTIVSIYASGRIVATGEFDALSDRRIKNILNVSNSADDLKKLMKINITDYKYIDTLQYNNRIHKKVIAQQVEAVYPEAVNTNKDYIPNVFQLATSVKKVENGIEIITTKPHDFAKGDNIKIERDNGKGLEIAVVKEVVDASTFVIEGDKAPEKIFVYGKMVNDLKSVDYDALSTLNISATQELAKEIDSLKSVISHQSSVISNLQSSEGNLQKDNENMKAEIEKIKQQLGMAKK